VAQFQKKNKKKEYTISGTHAIQQTSLSSIQVSVPRFENAEGILFFLKILVIKLILK